MTPSKYCRVDCSMRLFKERYKNSWYSPIGLGTARTWLQSNGRLFNDQTTGCVRWDKFSDTAIKAQVSCRMAKRLKNDKNVG